MLSCVIILNSSEPFYVWLCLFLVALYTLRKQSWIFILLSIFTFTDLKAVTLLPKLSESRIVELNASSFVVANDLGKILVYTKNIDRYNLMDEVTVTSFKPFEFSPSTYGFDQKAYSQTNDLIGTADETMVTNHSSTLLFEFFGFGGFNKDPRFVELSRAVLFQSDPLTDFVALISLGLLYTMIFKIGQFLMSFFLNEFLATMGMLIVFAFGAFYFAYPISLIRVMVSIFLSMVFRNRKDRLIAYVLFFMLYNAAALSSMAVLYPFMFMVFGAFKVDRISRWSSLGYIQCALVHQFSLIMIILYPIFRKLMVILVIFVWIGFAMPLINPVLFFFDQVLEISTALFQRLVIIRGTLSISLLITLSVLFLLQLRYKQSMKNVFFIVLFLIPILSSPYAYQLTIISVGQGDSILLQSPFNQEVILIDTGKPSAYGQLTSFLNAQGISKIDTLIMTHDDNDHAGNRESLQKDYRIMRSVTTPTDINSVWFTLKSLKTTLSKPTDNQASLVYLLQINGIRFLLMADADEVNELDLIRQYPDLKAEILKVGHHGSATSTSEEFLSHIQARMALISVGYNNYGHPSWRTLDRLENQHVSVMTTRDEGDIQFVFMNGFSGLSTSLSKLKPLRLGF